MRSTHIAEHNFDGIVGAEVSVDPSCVWYSCQSEGHDVTVKKRISSASPRRSAAVLAEFERRGKRSWPSGQGKKRGSGRDLRHASLSVVYRSRLSVSALLKFSVQKVRFLIYVQKLKV
jgi:hypothetical protein